MPRHSTVTPLRALEPRFVPAEAPPLTHQDEAEALACLRAGLPVLVLGESGVGKTRVARALAAALDRGPVVRATLGSSEDLNTIISELFGHERGSFSGAVSARLGLVAQAHGGTLILDEVLNLRPHAQQVLLDFTQFGSYRPLGHASAEPCHADVRLIAATNGDLEAAVREGRFREDLYHRLSGFVLRVAPLRERRDAIPELAQAILAGEHAPNDLSEEAIALLSAPHLEWPGNVRQLRSTLLRARARATIRGATTIDACCFPELGGSEPAVAPTRLEGDLGTQFDRVVRARGELEREEARLIRLSLVKWGGVISRAANEIGMKRTSLISRMKCLGVSRWPDEEEPGR
ncbi:MAG: hypothetical protein SangKO_031030 [Sandaracinaceae bacterium]